MKKIFCILLACLVIAACDSSSPQAIQKRQIKQIEKEQKRESEEFDKLVKQNPNIVHEIKDRVVSDMNRGVREQAVYDHKAMGDYSGVYTNKANSFSIELPDGWYIADSYSNPNGSGVTAKSSDQRGFIVVQHQKMKNAEKMLVQYSPHEFTRHVTLNNLQLSCPDANISQVATTQEQGYRGVESVIDCGNNSINDTYLAHKNDTYHLMGAFNNRDQRLYDSVMRSLLSFKIIKMR
jgi:hypothetical protein